MPLPESHIKTNPNGKSGTESLQLYINRELKEFYGKKLCLDHGWPQRIVPFLLEKLMEACLSSGLSPSWDEGNADAVAEILARVNFETPKKNVKRK